MVSKYLIKPIPEKGPGKVLLKHVDFPDQIIELQMWEYLFHLNWAQNGWYRVVGQSDPWENGPEGSVSRQMVTVDGAKAKIELKPTEEALLITLTASNITKQVNHEFWGVYDMLIRCLVI
ncbi:MAG: hypothetical protein ABIG61_06550 [Planctomycetota bacterium]